jgi:hypothetical protein
MKTRSYIKPWRMALYVLCGTVLGFGVITAVSAWLFSKDIQAFLGTVLFSSEAAVLDTRTNGIL